MMKQLLSHSILFFSCLFLFFLQEAQSQTEKGSILINGRTNLSFEFADDAPFEVGLLGAYFPADNLAAGLDVAYDNREVTSDLLIRPFVRYYLFKRLFFGTGLRYQADIAPNVTVDEFSWDLEVGGLIMLTDNVGIEPALRVPIPRESNVKLLIGFSIFF
jgi:hypothetical protein